MKDSSVPFSFISLGCARTLVDSESMINELKEVGFKLVPEGALESVTVLNTCSFIQSAVDETESNILSLSEKKKAGKIQHLAVVGCYPSRFKREELTAKFPDVDLWLTTQEQVHLKTRLSQLVFQKKFTPKEQSSPYTKLTPSHYSYLKISEGCDNWCSFCTIPKIRGKHRSIPLDKVLDQARKYIQFGAQELLIVAEDTTAWGEDLYRTPSFPLLMKALAELPVKWIRPMYIFPSRVTDELIDVMAAYPDKFPYLDIPIQHVSTRLLEAMNRRHDAAFIEDLMRKFKARLPHLAIRTTFIAGYPSETEEDVAALLSFMERFEFSHVGCFGYSDEAATRSFKAEGKLDLEVIQSRIDRIMTRQFELLSHRHVFMLGKTVEVVYEGNGVSRAAFQAPDVDGTVLISNPEGLVPGRFYTVRLDAVQEYDFKGTRV